MAAGYQNTFIIDLNNNIWTCGGNDHILMSKGTNNKNKLRLIPKFKSLQVSVGNFYTLIIGTKIS